MAKATKETVKFWEGKISEWKESGLSRERFFEKEGLNRSTAGYWFRKLQRGKEERGFVEIRSREVMAVSGEGLRVRVRDKYTIEVSGTNFDVLVFSEVVKALEKL